MSGLLFLQTEDFTIQKGMKGNILCHNIRGLSLILFYSTNCQYSRALIPVFKRLPGQLGGCQFGMINISSEKMLIEMSKATISEIKYVPLIILYVAGKPFIRYDGPSDENEIKRFIFEVSNKIQSKEKFTGKQNQQPANQQQSNNKRAIPAYASGQPLWGDSDEFYLEFAEAYT